MDRRHFLTAGVLLVAGCSSDDGNSGDGGDSDIQDSDGDGVIDSEDYAPNDPDVQEKSDIQDGGSTPTATPTEEPDALDSVDDIEFPSDTPTPEPDNDDLDIDLDDLTDMPEHVEHSDTHTVQGPGYYQIPVEFDREFSMEWTVTNQKSGDYDFDVFLMAEDEYQDYLDYINDEDSRRPEYYVDGTAQGIEASASRSLTLSGGTYRLIIDNTDYGDAGDFGAEAERRVRVEISAGTT
ncbi:hypothetical protein C475_16756 [Halosimplex carlsbadense 2-9-1]|uniref:Uncharacterized protein n=1 Tax=Halosimplex carlsbadense 2-9-1 TaxID=797114 RepID=M0CHR1_9EURY|nr:hypothetical protein [Halosimplex carlsbadense]ELZ22771.1 hypothetical protein C475_16756 [Halosimplex carlsbadense 2-9-1]